MRPQCYPPRFHLPQYSTPTVRAYLPSVRPISSGSSKLYVGEPVFNGLLYTIATGTRQERNRQGGQERTNAGPTDLLMSLNSGAERGGRRAIHSEVRMFRPETFDANDESFDIGMRHRSEVVTCSLTGKLPSGTAEGVEERGKEVGSIVFAFPKEGNNAGGVYNDIFLSMLRGIGCACLGELSREGCSLLVVALKINWPFFLDMANDIRPGTVDLVLDRHAEQTGERWEIFDRQLRYTSQSMRHHISESHNKDWIDAQSVIKHI